MVIWWRTLPARRAGVVLVLGTVVEVEVVAVAVSAAVVVLVRWLSPLASN
jgi:hypothetical protein